MSARPLFFQHGGAASVDTKRDAPTDSQIEAWLSDAELAGVAEPKPVRPWWSRAWRAVLRAWKRWQIYETEQYLEDCRNSGIADSLSLRDFRAQLEELRVELYLLED